MKNRTLPLSLLIGAALTIPSLAMAAPAETAQADMQNATTATKLETDVGVADNESVSNQSNSFQISETQRISRASGNNNANQQQMAPELQAQQQAMLLEQDAMQDPQESMQAQQQDMQAQQQAMRARQQAMQQAQQQAMQDPEEAMQQQDMLDEEDLLESEEDDQ